MIGEQTVHLMQILQHYNGRCENLELAMDLLYESKSEGRQLKNGELVAVFNGLKIDMSSLPSQNGNSNSGGGGNMRTIEMFTTTPNTPVMRSSILNGGIRSRMRLQSAGSNTPSSTSSSSQNGIPAASSTSVQQQQQSVMSNGANGSLVQVQSPSTGAVRRTSGINQWDQPPPQIPPGVLLPGQISNQRMPPQAYSQTPSHQQQPQPPPQMIPAQQGQVVQVNGDATRDEDDEELPAGWERRIDPYGRRYYVDHNTRST